ncbi:MAG: hypothetical protein H6707_02455 [Deltaproteobacteria bacterium]|nr:hypothetical protein [Deltaproteobacteria bacterium]
MTRSASEDLLTTLTTGTPKERSAALKALIEDLPAGWEEVLCQALQSEHNQGKGFAKLRSELCRQLAGSTHAEIPELLWGRLRDDVEPVAKTIAYVLWRYPSLVRRLPTAIVEHWDADRPYAERLLDAMIDADHPWPVELNSQTPAEVRARLQENLQWRA